MKKICFITTISATLESFVLPVAKYLLETTDWQIYMICDDDSEFKKELPTEIIYIPVSMKRGITLSGIKSMLKMKEIFKKEKFDLIQYSTPNASLYAALAGKFAKVPVRLYCQWGLAFVGMNGIKKRIFKQIEKITCKLSTWIEPDSKSNLKFAHEESLYKEEIGSVIGNGSACGVKLEKFDIYQKYQYREIIREKWNISKDVFVFGFVGRVTHDKGVNELLKAFKLLLEHQNEIVLLIVGEIEGKDTLNQELFEWSLKCKNIVYTGNTKVVEQYLSSMDCYILPSYREGFGMGTIEAEAMEVPVVVTNIPGPIDAMIPEVTGKIVNKQDVESLYNAMLEIYSLNNEARIEMGKEGRNFVVENFEQKKLCHLILEDRKRLMNI